ncbi:WD repeat-containing protein 41 [Apodemus speciosus]|uniref:WD repeat-containing protein 41 n=1 Tax=Apodemus speciosus TaxID=105296 RepID=A0ABQ0FHC3_APOSI
MLRWLIGGGREPQGLAEKAALQTVGEGQGQNPYTELLVLKAHRDIVRFLVPLDDVRFASAGDDGIIVVWNAQCLIVLRRLDVCHLSDTGISALVEIPGNCVAAAVGRELRLITPTEELLEWDIIEVKRLLDHQDNILSLASINDTSFATGSHVGELIVWDALDWSVQACERTFWSPTAQLDAQQEIKLCQKQNDISINHFTCDEENIFAAVGRGLYVYNLQLKRVIACQKTAHDSNILHIEKLPNRQLISCSEDGAVRMWEVREKQQLAAEPVPTGFFNMWGFGRVNKQASQPVKKQEENVTTCSLELIGDLIGHSSSVEMFLYFEDHGLVTCSADHLIILWKNGERESGLRSLKLFQKLEENGDLYPEST